MINQNLENYQRNAIIFMVIFAVVDCSVGVMHHFDIISEGAGLGYVAMVWASYGFISNAVLVFKNWYDGYQLTVGHLFNVLILTILGPIIAFCIIQFGVRYISHVYYDKFNNNLVISIGRKSARVLRTLSN